MIEVPSCLFAAFGVIGFCIALIAGTRAYFKAREAGEAQPSKNKGDQDV